MGNISTPKGAGKGKSSPKAKPSFDTAKLAELLPDETQRQKDLTGHPIQIGDRVDDTECHGGGIVVSVFGNVLIYLCDYHNGDPAMGRYTYASCSAVRVMLPVTDLEHSVAEVLMMRTELDDIQRQIEQSGRENSFSLALTRIQPEEAIDEEGQQIDIGDTIHDCGYDVTGVVIAIAGKMMLVQISPETFEQAIATQSRIILKRTAARKGGAK